MKHKDEWKRQVQECFHDPYLRNGVLCGIVEGVQKKVGLILGKHFLILGVN